MKEPDFDRLADISKRLEDASKQPGYSKDVFARYAAEARAACGDYPEYMEFLGTFLPGSNASPNSPANALSK